jgi:hypothetical protein
LFYDRGAKHECKFKLTLGDSASVNQVRQIGVSLRQIETKAHIF